MVNENINKFIPESVKKPIATVSYFNEAEWNKDLSKEDLKWQEAINDSYQVEIDSQERGYGPRSYSDCRHSTDFKIEIEIEGLSRKWARKPACGNFLPGHWEWSPLTSNYLYRQDLWLTDVDQGDRVRPLLRNDDVYTVNLWGKHTSEDYKFCNAAWDLIDGAVKRHKNYGDEIQIKETFSSDDYRLKMTVAKWGAIAATSVVSPGTAIVAGATAWTAGQIGQEACDSERGKRFWGSVGGMGGDAFLGGVSNGITKSLFDTSGFCESWNAHENKVIDFAKEFGGSLVGDVSFHKYHQSKGKHYDSDCTVCNP